MSSPREQVADWEIQDYTSRIEASAWRYDFSARWLAAILAVPLGVSLLLPANPEEWLARINLPYAIGLGIFFAVLAWGIAFRYTSPRIDATRSYVSYNLANCGIMDALYAADSYLRMPRLGAHKGRYGVYRVPLRRQAVSLRGKLEHLLRSYTLCARDMKVSPWTGFDRAITSVGLGVIFVGLLWLRLNVREMPADEAAWMTAHAWVWHAAAWIVLLALPLTAWDSCVDAAALRFAVCDALKLAADQTDEIPDNAFAGETEREPVASPFS